MDMSVWFTQMGYQFKIISNLQLLLAKLLAFPMPTVCVISGHAYAGGLIFALSHDFRIMKAGSGKLCLSEISVGKALGPAYANLVKHLMPR